MKKFTFCVKSRRWCALLLGLVFAMNMVAQSGTTGSLTWKIEDGTLTISGEGAMPGYSSADGTPWYSNRNNITKVIIEDGVTSIGNYAFRYCSNLNSITIPNNVTSIGYEAF